jgi:hypothetical protein
MNRTKRSFGRRLLNALGWAFLLSAMVMVLLVVALMSALGLAWHELNALWVSSGAPLGNVVGEGVRISIGGHSVNLGQIHSGQLLVAGICLVLALALVLTVVFTVLPVVLLLALSVAVLSVVFGLGGAVVAVGGAALLVLSPLLLVAGIIWLIVRKPRQPPLTA